MLTFPTTPNRHKDKDVHHAHDHSPAPSIKSASSSAKSKRTVSMHSPGKHKHRSPSESGLAAIVPLTTNPLLAPLCPPAAHDHATTTPIGPQPGEPAPAKTSWEEKRDRHVARRTRSLSFISGFLPRTRSSSRAESVSTTVEHSISDSGTLASEELTQGPEEKEQPLQLEPTFDLPQYQLVVVEESTAEEEQVAEEEMDFDSLEPPPIADGSEAMEGSYALEPPDSPDVITEPEVPDPFLVDDEGDALSEEERDAAARAPVEAISESHEQNNTPAHEISLLPQETSAAVTPAVSPSPVVDKDVPALPSTESEKEEAPELFVPALIAPSMFLPIPNTDPLTILLSKYIYPPEKRPIRDLTGDWQRSDFHTLVMTNSWRALARMARDRLVTANPEDLTLILNLWYIRLSSLSRLRLFNQTSAECTNLFAVLNAIEPPDARAWLFDNILPFELDVMHARLKYWAGDHMGYLDALHALLRECKIKARQAGRQAAALAASRAKAGATLTATAHATTDGSAVTATMWKERGVRICLIMASQLMEMNDIAAATKLMEPLCQQPDHAVTADGAQQDAQNTSIPALRSVVGRMYLQAGNLHLAARHFSEVTQDPSADATMKEMNAALFACADGQWEKATIILGELLEKDADNFVAANNKAVALLGQGRVREGIAILENALQTSPSSVVVAEPFLFNLATLYELRYAGAIEKKRDLLVEVAKWSGDGLKTSCMKMPTS